MAVVAVSASVAHADLVVDFGGEYTTGNVTLSQGFNDIGGPSGQFSIAYDTGPFVIEDLTGHFPYDSISYGVFDNSKTDHKAAVWWASEDTWTYDGMAADDVLFTIGNYIMSIDNVYFFVKDDGTYYRSPKAHNDARFNIDPADPMEFTRDDLDDTAWVEFDPMTLAVGSLTSSIDDLDEITEFGMFYEDSSQASFIDGFEAYAVPEPVTLTMLGVGGSLALLRRRRR
jgi:hypothetical protein